MATIYQKTPSDKCIILEPGEVLTRPMALPATWSHIRLAVAVSLTGLSDPNSSATGESISYLGEAFHFYFGISSGSIGVHQPGSKFIGISDNNGLSPLAVYPPGDTSFNTIGHSGWDGTFYYATTMGDNGGVARGDPPGTLENFRFFAGAPSGDVNYACIWVVDIQVGNGGGGQQNIATQISLNSCQSSFTDSDMKTALSTGTFSTPLQLRSVSFIPNDTTPPVDMFYFSLPLNQNRVRIHNYGYLVIA